MWVQYSQDLEGVEAFKHIDVQRSELVTLQVPVRRDIIQQTSTHMGAAEVNQGGARAASPLGWVAYTYEEDAERS